MSVKKSDGILRGGLVLSRRVGERVLIGDDLIIELLDIRSGQARIRFEAPQDMTIWREEVFLRIKKEHGSD